MTTIDNEATTMLNNPEEATQIADSHSSSASVAEENTVIATGDTMADGNNDVADEKNDDKKKDHKAAKIAGGIALGGAVASGAASVFMDGSDDSSEEHSEEIEEQEGISIAAEVVELPELIVEALAPQHAGHENPAALHGDAPSPTSETLFSEISDSMVEDTVQMSNYQTKPEEAIAAQPAANPEEDHYGEDIAVVSVGNQAVNESDVQVLGVTQDISTGYNVGHLLVDGEEVVVIDVDGDMVFDSMVVDFNHDGDTTPNEIVDIRQHSLTIDDFASNTDIFTDPTSATGDVPDYLSENF